MTLRISIENNKVILLYFPQRGTGWLKEIFEDERSYLLKKTFNLSKEDECNIDESNEDCISFFIGQLEDDYYKIFKHILNTKFDVFIHKNCNVNINFFIANNQVSILKKLEALAAQAIVVGGNKENSIPFKDFKDILESFPTATEKDYYANSRITNIISQYLDNIKDYGKLLENYRNKKAKVTKRNYLSLFNEYERDKYSFILENLKEMLIEPDSFLEKDWQNEILEIILLLYPKYIQCLSKVKIKDFYSNKNREIDLVLLDSNNNVDIIEIKRPFSNCIIRNALYRDNYTPQRELSGTIMQVEKYIFNLNKWGIKGEETLTQKYQTKLILQETIKITNPKGVIIMGRDNNLSQKQLFDFEIIKRKYSNIIDIITYDDLIRRLELLLLKFTV